MGSVHTARANKREKSVAKKCLPLIFAAVVLVLFTAIRGARAQSDVIAWSEQANLSNTPESSGRPAIVADRLGNVHVFWSEDVGGPSIINIPGAMNGTGNTIYYRRWNGKYWTPPVDILYVPNDGVADYLAATVDDNNWLHVVWTGQSDFYYSKAPAWQADSAQSWSTPVVVASNSARSQWESDLVVSPDGTVHIVYATRGDDPGIYHIASRDGGAIWEPPVKISDLLDSVEAAFSNARIIKDGRGRLHVVWQTDQKDGYGQAAYYARSTDGGITWSKPLQLGYREPQGYDVSWPAIASIGDSELHLIYLGGGTLRYGRMHRISRDGGETWSEPNHILTDMEGINGYDIPLVDSAGGLHLVINMRTRNTQLGGLYYARWLGNEWSPVVPIATEPLLVPSAHWMAATMSMGDEIHIVWNSNFVVDRGAGEIGYIRGKIPGVAALPVASIPEASAAEQSTSSAGSVQTGPVIRQDKQQVPVVPQQPASLGILDSPLLPAIVAALVLVGGIVVWRIVFSWRKINR